MILEGIVTTMDLEGVVNIAPMGPHVDATMKRLVLRPFQTSRTYQNLKAHGDGVFHVVDDVLLLAQAAVGRLEAPLLIPATQVQGHILPGACRFYEFRVTRIDDAQERATMETRVLTMGGFRDFFGFNRAKHAVVEAAILATRLHLLPPEQLRAEFDKLAVLVEKTGGKQEHEAFQLLREHVQRSSTEANPEKQGDDWAT